MGYKVIRKNNVKIKYTLNSSTETGVREYQQLNIPL